MSKNYYNIYLNNILDFASTVCIKSEESASAINEYLVLRYGEIYTSNDIFDIYSGSMVADPYVPSEWKYYKNISGEYHFTDLISLRDDYKYGTDKDGNAVLLRNIKGIKITSLDDLTEIVFNKENLKLHITTRNAYQYGQRHYRELVSKYPEFEQTILGILYPADINKALESPNCQILAYPEYLLESNEVSLVNKLNDWLLLYKIRWDNKQFITSDSLYSTAQHAQTYLTLVNKVLALRLEACKTNEVHSFHVRQYLISHGLIDSYLDFLTLKQTLFFYRNINYIERNNGKRHIFAWLVEKIMTDRNLPIDEISMKHNVSNMIDSDGNIVSLYPELTFKRKSLNNIGNYFDVKKYSLDEILAKERFNTEGNGDYIDANIQVINSKLVNSLSSVVATKMLESSIVDYSGSAKYTLHDILLNNWLYLSSIGYYSGFITFKNPKTNADLSLSALDCYLYMSYCLAKALGSNVVTIPKLLVQRAVRVHSLNVTDVTFNEIKAIVDSKYVSDTEINDVLNLKPVVSKSITPEAFYRTCTDIFNASVKQVDYVNSKNHFYTKTLIENSINRIYFDGMIDTGSTGILFEDWLVAKFIPNTAYSQEEYLALFKNIFEATTGTKLNTVESLINVQKSMISLFKQLSSYSIDFLYEINGNELTVVNTNPVGPGNIGIELTGHFYVQNRVADAIDVNSIMYNVLPVEINKLTYTLIPPVLRGSNITINNYLNITSNSATNYNIMAYVPGSRVTLNTVMDTPFDNATSAIIGISTYTNLSNINKRTLKDVYTF